MLSKGSHARGMMWPVWSLGLFLTLGTLATAQKSEEALRPVKVRPNIVVVLVDDLGWADIGTNGSTFHRTPNIDRLAGQGISFRQGYAAAPVCSPSRASLMTGKYPARLHLTDWLPGRRDMPSQQLLRPEIQQGLSVEEITLAEALKGAGYVTANIGKWHLGGEGSSPSDHGFDLNIGGNAAGSPAAYFYPYQHERIRERKIPGLDEGLDGEYLTDRLTDEALGFIENNRTRPFFLCLSHFAVHIPLAAKEELIAEYLAAPSPSGAQTNTIYAAMLQSVDDGVGRLMALLDKLEIANRTVIVFTSDNGGLSVKEGPNTPATSNAPLRAGKGYLYEGGIRVPWIVYWPGETRPASVSDVPVSTIDLYPTLLELAGAPVPEGQRIDGKSLVPLVRGQDAAQREALFWHYPHYSNQGGKPGGAVRMGDWKLIEWYEDGRLELFNLADDIEETNDLAGRWPQRAKTMAEALENWRRNVQAQSMSPNPDYSGPNRTRASAIPPVDAGVLLHARDVTVHGTTVRYEPQPHKDTIGFWTRAGDWVSWDFVAPQSGTYSVSLFQGCGTGSGGSEVEISVNGQVLRLTVEETGGFQKFIEKNAGTVHLHEGEKYTLSVRPKTKPGLAVMDLRWVHLKPATP